MKHKFSLIWRVAVALVLVLSFSLVAAVPASADVSSATVELSDYSVNTAADYTITFTTGADLDATDSMVFTFPSGTAITDTTSDHYLETSIDVSVDGATATHPAAPASVNVGAREIDLIMGGGWSASAGSSIEVVFNINAGEDLITNPTTAGVYALKVHTDEETTDVASKGYSIDGIRIVDSEDNVLDTVVNGTSFYVHVTDAASVWNTHPAMADTFEVTVETYDGVAIAGGCVTPISTATYTATENGKTTNEFWTEAISTADLGVRPGYKLVAYPTGITGTDDTFIRAEISFDKGYYDINETMTITVKDDTANISSTADPETLLGADCGIFWDSDVALDVVGVTDFVETGKDTGIFQCQVVPSTQITAGFGPGDTMEIHYENTSYATTVTPDAINDGGTGSEEIKTTAYVLMYTTSSVAFDKATYAVTETSATVTVTDADKDAAGIITGANCLVVENVTTGDSVSFNSLSEGATAGEFPQIVTFGTGTDELPINDGDQLKATYTDPATPEDVSTATANIGTPVSLYNADGDLVDSYTTIAAALAVDDVDYTIEVGPGTYSPTSRLIIDKEGVTLKGANYGVNPVTETRGAESIIDATAIDVAINILESNVTVEGFTVDGSSGSGILIEFITTSTDTEGVTIKNNIISDTGNNGVCLAAKAAGGGAVVTKTTISGNLIEDCNSGICVLEGANNLTISNNKITGSKWTFDGAIVFDKDNDNNTITGNILTDNLGSGIVWDEGATSANNLVEGNTISGNAGKGIWVWATAPTELVITGNDITDNEGVGILVESWDATNAIKFNNITGNDTTDGYGLQNSSSGTVDATHNWWGATSSTDIAAMINDVTSSDVTSYDPWLDASVSVAAFVQGDGSSVDVGSLDAEATVGVEVSGVPTETTNYDNAIGAALYTANPKAIPEFTPLENGFFDVYVNYGDDTPGDTDEVILKFYAANENSMVYAWNELGMWEECTLQDFVSYGGGYIWVKVHSELNTTAPTTPTIEGLQYLPFAISGEEVPEDILAYYRGLGLDPNVVETTDLLKAANDWANEVVPPGFTECISTTQLLTLANEWAATE